MLVAVIGRSRSSPESARLAARSRQPSHGARQRRKGMGPGHEARPSDAFRGPGPSARWAGQWKKECVTPVLTPPSVRKIVNLRVTAATLLVFVAGLLVFVSGSAGAAPMPTISQVQARLNKLQSQSERLDQQYDQVLEELSATNQRLGLINKELAAYSGRFKVERGQVTRIAITVYEDGNLNSSIALLTSGNPQQILNQSSILLELSSSDNAQINQFLAAARQLASTQQLARRTRAGILELKAGLDRRRRQMDKLVSQEQALLAQLTPAQQVGTGPGVTPIKGVKYTGPTTTQADKAVAYAYDQIGCPYVYGGTGPCPDGFDCSGLTMEAWAAAGVSIPRTSYEQWDDLPHVSEADMEPGDIMVFNGAGHVGLYVGHGELIDAPHTGADVELVAFNGWYAQTFMGAVRP
jgi:peptidoglycan DL-endopeptidase CwlO